jgi:hypothetical protein
MLDFVAGLILGSLLTLVPVLVRDRRRVAPIAPSHAPWMTVAQSGFPTERA